MNSIKLLLLCFGLLITCAYTQADTMENLPEQQIANALDSFHLAAAQAKGDKYFSLLTDEAVFIGTDAKERWSKQEFEAYAKPHFSKGKGWTYLPRDRHITVSADGQVAWFDELLDNKKYGECRGTGVLVKRGERWHIAQYHLTIPLPNELVGEVSEIISKYKDSAKP
jgi:ketosteroid isomerase-like protein